MSLTKKHIIILGVLAVSIGILFAYILKNDNDLLSCIEQGRKLSEINNNKKRANFEKRLNEYSPIAYSDFLAMIRLGKIDKAIIQEVDKETIVFFNIKDGKKYIAKSYLDRGLVGDLIANNIKFDVQPAGETSMASEDEFILNICSQEINIKGFDAKVKWLESELKRSGFKDLDEMNRLVKQGFSDKAKYDLLLKQFDSEGDFKDALSKGFKSRAEYDNYWDGEKSKGDFSSIAELKDALSRGVTNKTDYKDALAKERLLAEKKANENKEQAYLQWQNNSLNIIKDYHNKTKLINNTSAFGPGRNLSRSEQQEYDAMVSNAKKTMTEIIGKEIRSIQCWYLGLQTEADEELWCYSKKFAPDLLYKVKISPADAKKLGSHYKDDEFLFTGDVYKLDLTGVTIGRGGRAEEQPVVIMVKSKMIRRVR